MRRKKVLVFCADPKITSSWYRIIRPLELVGRELPLTFTISSSKEIDWTIFSGVDLIVAMRPGNVGNDAILQRAKDKGIPIIADYDDDMSRIPFHHKDWELYAAEQSKKSLKKCLELSDQVWVTTEHLADRLKEVQPKLKECRVIPNAIDNVRWPEPTKPHENQPDIMLWRGGQSHALDLLNAKIQFQLIAEQMPIMFFGMKPWIISNELPRHRWTWVPGVYSPEDFFVRLKFLQAKRQFNPLVDDTFNRSKSNIAWLEGSWYGGSCVFCPQWWCNDFGAIGLTDISEDERQSTVLMSQQTIREKYLLTEQNKGRSLLISEMLSL